MSHTIYHAHGIGEAALDGLKAAKRRIEEARRRLYRQPPAPLPPIDVPPPPELPTIRGNGLNWFNDVVAHFVAADERGSIVVGSVDRHLLRELRPAEILDLTEKAEALAAELEASADAREAEIERVVEAALRDADPAIRALAERMSEEWKADQERVDWIREHGSPRLKRMLEEGIEHMATYRSERLALERPGWSFANDVRGDADEPRNPPKEAFDLLDEARAIAADAQLVYWVAERDCEGCRERYCPDHGEDYTVRGYTCVATFLGRKIVFRVTADGTPPLGAHKATE